MHVANLHISERIVRGQGVGLHDQKKISMTLVHDLINQESIFRQTSDKALPLVGSTCKQDFIFRSTCDKELIGDFYE